MKTVLIVDDEPKICDILARFFEARGLETRSAKTVRDALECLQVSPPDYLILDLLMPDGSGLDVLEIAKARYPKMPVVILTVMDDPEMEASASALGASDYIKKPFDLLDDRKWARAFFAFDE